MDTLETVQAVAALTMVALAILELRDPGFRVGVFAPGRRRARNWAFFVTSFVPTMFVQAIVSRLAELLPTLTRPGTLPAALDFLLCVLVAEWATWTLHWVKHRHPFLWCFHFQHHREEHFNVWMVTHTHALEVAVSGTLMVTLLLGLGFAPLSVHLYFALYSVALMYHHSSRAYSLGWLDRIIVSPAYHRRHHWRLSDGNFAGALTLWDLVFRTAHWPEPGTEQVPVGLPSAAVEPFGYRSEMLYFLGGGRQART